MFERNINISFLHNHSAGSDNLYLNYFLYLKCVCQKNHHFCNATNKELAKVLDVKRDTASRIKKYWLLKGWCRIESEHLVLLGFPRLYEKEGIEDNPSHKVTVEIHQNPKETKLHIQKALLLYALEQTPSLSTDENCRLWNRTKSAMYRIRKSMSEKRWFTFIRRFETLLHNVSEAAFHQFRHSYPGAHAFYSYGRIMVSLPSQIKYIEYG